jgi:hypothetical protein
MQVFKQLMAERGRSCSVISIGDNRVQALIDTWMHMLTVARFLGETRAINPDTAPLVEAFKKLL